MIQDVITIALVCNEEVMLIHAYISALKGEVLRGDDKMVCPPNNRVFCYTLQFVEISLFRWH